MTAAKKQKPPLAVRVGDELQAYLRAKAAQGHRTITAEIRMRLEHSRLLDAHPAPGKGEAPAAPTAGASIEEHGANRADLLTQNPSQEPDHAE